MKLPKRKPNRLTAYDYSMSNAYFITICTNSRRNLFWENPREHVLCSQEIKLSRIGAIVDRAIRSIPKHYSAIAMDHYVVMPNHVHMLLRISSENNGRPMVAPTVSTAIQQMKGVVSKQAGFPVWQKGFYDHVVRGYRDYQEVWEYIDSNPVKWNRDCFHQEA